MRLFRQNILPVCDWKIHPYQLGLFIKNILVFLLLFFNITKCLRTTLSGQTYPPLCGSEATPSCCHFHSQPHSHHRETSYFGNTSLVCFLISVCRFLLFRRAEQKYTRLPSLLAGHRLPLPDCSCFSFTFVSWEMKWGFFFSFSTLLLLMQNGLTWTIRVHTKQTSN